MFEMDKTTLYSHIYRLQHVMNSAHSMVCCIKLLAFAVIDCACIWFTKWDAFQKTGWITLLVWLGVGYSMGLCALFAAIVLIRKGKYRSIAERTLVVWIFPLEYMVLPLKTLLTCWIIQLLKIHGGSAKDLKVVIWISLLDLGLTMVATQIMVYTFRCYRPDRSVFFSMFDSSLEHLILLITPLRSLLFLLMTFYKPETVVYASGQVVVVISGLAITFFLFKLRPFFNTWADKYFTILIATSSFITSSIAACSSPRLLLQVVIFCTPFVVLVLVRLHSLVNEDKLELRKSNPKIQYIKKYLMDGKVDANSIEMKGLFRVHQINYKGFTRPDFGKKENRLERGISSVSIANPLFSFKEVKAFKNAVSGYTFMPSIFSKSRKDASKLTVHQRKKSTIQAFSKSDDQLAQRGQDQENDVSEELSSIREYINRHYFEGDDIHYKTFLHLMWVLNHRLSLGELFSLLSKLKKSCSTLKSSYLLFYAQKEIECKLTYLELYNTKTILPYHLTEQEVEVNTSQKNGRNYEMKLRAQAIVQTSLEKYTKEHLNLTRPIEYKNEIIKLTQMISQFTKANSTYIEMLTFRPHDLMIRINISKNLFDLDKKIAKQYGRIGKMTEDCNFQHMVPYFYHLYYNANKHKSAEKLKLEIQSRYLSMRNLKQKSQKTVMNFNSVNECLILMMESQQSRFGTIQDVYGKNNILVDQPEELIGRDYTIFMNDTLTELHKEIESNIFEYKSRYLEAGTFSKQKIGFLRVPDRSLIVPSTTVVKICPMMKFEFKFVSAIKPDFKDSNLYITLKNSKDELTIEGFSSNFLNLCEEDCLSRGLHLSKVCPASYHYVKTSGQPSKPIPSFASRSKGPNTPKIGSEMMRRHKNSFTIMNDISPVKSAIAANIQSNVNHNNTGAEAQGESIIDDKIELPSSRRDGVLKISKACRVMPIFRKFTTESMKEAYTIGHWYLCLFLSNNEYQQNEEIHGRDYDSSIQQNTRERKKQASESRIELT